METLKTSDPESIGPFKTVARLGAGGMGVVYLAQQKSQRVALKVISANFSGDTTALTRFRREAEALQKARSPFVASVIDSSPEQDNPWLAVEFVSGPSLKEVIEDKGSLELDEWWAIAIALSMALDAIHSCGVIHRDIKPANVLMSDRGPKVIDFGISHVSDETSVTATGLLAGSPAWLSPEQFEGTEVTTASDVFSLGTLLSYLATGVNPWGEGSSATSASLMRAITEKSPKLEGLSVTQLKFVEPLLAKEPSQRPSAQKLLETLSAVAPRDSEALVSAWLAANPVSKKRSGPGQLADQPKPVASKVPKSPPPAEKSPTKTSQPGDASLGGALGDSKNGSGGSGRRWAIAVGAIAVIGVVGGLFINGALTRENARDESGGPASSSASAGCPEYFPQLSSVTNDVVQGAPTDPAEVDSVIETLSGLALSDQRVQAALDQALDGLSTLPFDESQAQLRLDTAKNLITVRGHLGAGVCTGF